MHSTEANAIKKYVNPPNIVFGLVKRVGKCYLCSVCKVVCTNSIPEG